MEKLLDYIKNTKTEKLIINFFNNRLFAWIFVLGVLSFLGVSFYEKLNSQKEAKSSPEEKTMSVQMEKPQINDSPMQFGNNNVQYNAPVTIYNEPKKQEIIRNNIVQPKSPKPEFDTLILKYNREDNLRDASLIVNDIEQSYALSTDIETFVYLPKKMKPYDFEAKLSKNGNFFIAKGQIVNSISQKVVNKISK